MWALQKKAAAMGTRFKMSDEELMLTAQKPLPWKTGPPAEEALLALATCPTMQLLEERAMTVLAPRVEECDIPLVDPKLLALTHDSETEATEKLLEKIVETGAAVIVLIVPFTLDESVGEEWERLMERIPEEVRVLLVPAPTDVEDFGGKLDIVPPDGRVRHMGWRLCELGKAKGTVEYFTEAHRLAKDQQFEWPNFKVRQAGKKDSGSHATARSGKTTPNPGPQRGNAQEEHEGRQREGPSQSRRDHGHPQMHPYRRNRGGRGGFEAGRH
ncbi:unnamed protein product [Caenorhabditis sp. 36 PRJEB53466]|nr:unnamed protein product [Caenorhabditis sp. 36 PRJEB53466]